MNSHSHDEHYVKGGSVAHRVFHTRILPNLLLGRTANGLPEAFHRDALEAAERMGGQEGPLLLDSTSRGSSSELLTATG